MGGGSEDSLNKYRPKSIFNFTSGVLFVKINVRCITASVLVPEMAFGFYDSQDTEQEVYGNQKTEDIPQNDEMQMALKGTGRLRRFRRNVNDLLLTSERDWVYSV